MIELFDLYAGSFSLPVRAALFSFVILFVIVVPVLIVYVAVAYSFVRLGVSKDLGTALDDVFRKLLPCTAIQLLFVFVLMAVFAPLAGFAFGDEKFAPIFFLLFCVFGGKFIGRFIEK